jgi:hypothetical protein
MVPSTSVAFVCATPIDLVRLSEWHAILGKNTQKLSEVLGSPAPSISQRPLRKEMQNTSSLLTARTFLSYMRRSGRNYIGIP